MYTFLEDMIKTRDEMDNLFNVRSREYFSYPLLNIYDKEDTIEIETLVHGVRKEDLKLNFENNVLTISGQKKNNQNDNIRYIIQEREYGKFEKSLKIRIPINPDSIKAKYENGVLKITLEKTEDAKPKKIQIMTNNN